MQGGRYAGSTVNRSILVNGLWVAMKCNNGIVVTDLDVYNRTLRACTWSMNNEYPFTSSNTYMHRIIIDVELEKGLSVDHIDWMKTDNRLANLRIATQAEQNMNRFTRVDKVPACEELAMMGISRLPRGIRWDNTCGRYTCTVYKNSNGTRAGMNKVAKFKDCLDVYVKLLEADGQSMAAHQLGSARFKLAAEYNDILKSAHAFDSTFPDGPYANLDDIMDDLTYAKSIMAKLTDVQVTKGPANLAWRDVSFKKDIIARIKGETVTLYDACYRDKLGPMNWDVDASAPRVSKVPLASYVWNVLAKREIPDGHVVGAVSRRAFDVRLENLELVPGKQGYRGVDNDWVVPEGVDIGMRFLPKGVTVNNSKVMISQAGRLRPDEHGADKTGKWSKSVSKSRDNVQKLISEAIDCLKKTHDDFDASNVSYQRLLGEHIDSLSTLLRSGTSDSLAGEG